MALDQVHRDLDVARQRVEREWVIRFQDRLTANDAWLGPNADLKGRWWGDLA